MTTTIDRITQVLKTVFSNLYIPQINPFDIAEIAIIIFLFYFAAKAFKNTRTWVLFKGAAILALFYLISYLLAFNVITKIFESILIVFLIGIVVIFSPEIKKCLENIGTKRFKYTKKMLFKQKVDKYKISTDTIDEIVASCEQMSKDKTGALIVYENAIPLKEYADTGIKMESLISRQLLLNVFEHNTPLHDGAIIIKDDILVASTCYLPLSENKKISKKHGTRHRAALGISETTDAFTIVVSEETGKISVTRNGKITTVTSNELRTMLCNFREETVIRNKRKPLEMLKNNLILKITSIIVGILLWLIVINVSNPVVSKTISSIPVSIQNEGIFQQHNKTYTIDSNQYVTVKIVGHRSEIEKIKKEDITIIADMSRLSDINTVQLQASIDTADVEIEIYDDIMKVSTENCIETTFPITIEKIGIEAPSRYVVEIIPEQNNFNLQGPESVINRIATVVFKIDVTACDGDTSVTSHPLLYDKNGEIIEDRRLVLEKNNVNFDIKTLPTKEVSLIINPDCKDNIKQYINTFSAVPTTIRIAANDRVLNNMDKLELTIPIDIKAESLLKDTHTMRVNISEYVAENIYVPETYQNVDIVIGFVSEISKEISFNLADIDFRNFDEEKFTISTLQNEFKISIFGKKNEVMNASIETLVPYIDLSKLVVGINEVYIEYENNTTLNISGNIKLIIDAEEIPVNDMPIENMPMISE